MKSKRIIIITSIICVLIALATQLTIYRDWSFICQNTGSQKGYREWFFGLTTSDWYERSELEKFIEENHNNKLKFSWVSYKGTGYGLLTKTCGHGRPSNIMFSTKAVNECVKSLSDSEKLSLYETFKTHDRDKVENEYYRYIGMKIDNGY